MKNDFFCSVAVDVAMIIKDIWDHVRLLNDFLAINNAIMHFYCCATIIPFATTPCLPLRVPTHSHCSGLRNN